MHFSLHLNNIVFIIANSADPDIMLHFIWVFTAQGVCVCGGGGGTLISSYTHRLGSFFLVPNFEFQYFLGFSEK